MRDDVPSGERPSSRYYFRRSLDRQDLMPVIGAAVGAAIGIGAVVFYFARILAQRTPLLPEPGVRPDDQRVGRER